MAVRMALILKLDRDPDELEDESKNGNISHNGNCNGNEIGNGGGKGGAPIQWSWMEKQMRRRTWWAAYVLDRMVAGITNREPILLAVDEAYDNRGTHNFNNSHSSFDSNETMSGRLQLNGGSGGVRMPSADEVWESMIPFQDLPVSMIADSVAKESLFKHLWELIKIYYRVVAFSRGTGSFTNPSTPLYTPVEDESRRKMQDEFSILDKELEGWFAGLPISLKGKLERVNENTVFAETMSGDLPWLGVVLVMTYHGEFSFLYPNFLNEPYAYADFEEKD
jgi:hypothetical protein